MTVLDVPPTTLREETRVSFSDWKRRLDRRGVLPIVSVAGSRGKSTVVRLLDAIFAAAELRTATWTDLGIEIDGRRQSGELGAWSRALTRLASGDLDIVIQEMDWSTVHAVGLPRATYPIMAVTNICANSEQCLIQGEARLATRVLPTMLTAVHPDGALVLNGEDYAIAGTEIVHPVATTLVANRRDSPLVRAHLGEGGAAAWVETDLLRVGDATHSSSIGAAVDLGFALGGLAVFQVQNALTAAAVATACGIPARTIREALSSPTIDALLPPGSFNVFRVGAAIAIVDRPTPSWFLRPILRPLTHHAQGRQIVVVGRLDNVPFTDLGEVGRLLGRSSTAILLHSEDQDPHRSAVFRQGVALTTVPPPIIHVPTERRAINRALRLARPNDRLLIFADHPLPVLRTLRRAANQSAT